VNVNVKSITDITLEPLQDLAGLLVSLICVQGYIFQTQCHF